MFAILGFQEEIETGYALLSFIRIMEMGIDMKLLFFSATALTLSFAAHAEDTSKDHHLVTSLGQDDMRFLAESLDHTVTRDFDEGVGILAEYRKSEETAPQPYALQGHACQEESGCLGLEVFIIFDGRFSPEQADTINRRWRAIKATTADGSLLLTRYLILDDGQTIGNIRTNIRNALAIGDQIADQLQMDIAANAPSIDFGEDTGSYANDGTCDDARFKVEGDEWDYQRQHVLGDASDCRALYESEAIKLHLDFGDNSGDYTNDGACDDSRFSGEGRSILQTDSQVKRDAVDCIIAYRAGTISRP